MSIYVVIDVEFDGLKLGLNSMISLGAVAINKNGDNFGDFEINFAPMENSVSDPVTMDWFISEAPDALNYCKKNQVPPKEAMNQFGDWLLETTKSKNYGSSPSANRFCMGQLLLLKVSS